MDDYWKPIWGRDGSFQDWPSEDWDAADHIPDELAVDFPEISINWQDINQWISIIRTLSNNKARGADGWSFEEFKLLPELCNISLPDWGVSNRMPVAERGHANTLTQGL